MTTRNADFYRSQFKRMTPEKGLAFMNACLRSSQELKEREWARRVFKEVYGVSPDGQTPVNDAQLVPARVPVLTAAGKIKNSPPDMLEEIKKAVLSNTLQIGEIAGQVQELVQLMRGDLTVDEEIEKEISGPPPPGPVPDRPAVVGPPVPVSNPAPAPVPKAGPTPVKSNLAKPVHTNIGRRSGRQAQK